MNEVIRVGMAEVKVVKQPNILTCVGLGSCVAIALYDTKKRIGGLAHIMLPERGPRKNSSPPAKFADSAVELLLVTLKRRGSLKKDMVAKIFGGANMFPHVPGNSLIHVGLRNSLTVKKALEDQDIKIIAQDLGGHWGRTIVFYTEDGSIQVKDAGGNVREY